MKVAIAHRIPGRTRFTTSYDLSYDRANKIKYLLERTPGVYYAKVSPVSGSIIVNHDEAGLKRACRVLLDIRLDALDDFEIEDTS